MIGYAVVDCTSSVRPLCTFESGFPFFLAHGLLDHPPPPPIRRLFVAFVVLLGWLVMHLCSHDSTGPCASRNEYLYSGK